MVSSGQLSQSGSQLGGPVRRASSVLDKMSAVTGKIQERAAVRKSYTLEADSDESFSAVKISGSGDLVSFIILIFLVFNFCRFCVVIRVFHPRHNGQ